jgi:hypothetical protein
MHGVHDDAQKLRTTGVPAWSARLAVAPSKVV